MKSVFVTVIAVFLFAATNAQTTIPNGGFETWTSQGSYENPDSWDSPNDVTSSLGKIVVEKESTIVHDGSFAAKITALSSLAGTLPGILTLGDFSFDLLSMSATIEGGTPFTGRPYSMTGWIQYEPQNNDICLIGAFLLKDNAGTWDTIAIAGFDTTVTLLSWTSFEAIFDYRNSDVPTHLNVLLLPADRNNPQPNSTLYVDGLNLVYTQSINETSAAVLQVNQNAGNGVLSISAMGLQNGTVSLFDVSGRKIMTQDYSAGHAMMDVSSLPQNIYVLSLESEGQILTRKIIL